MSAPHMKCVGTQWLVCLYEYMCVYFLDSPNIIINGFLCSRVLHPIDNGEPYLDECDESSDECSSENDSEEVHTSEAESEED